MPRIIQVPKVCEDCKGEMREWYEDDEEWISCRRCDGDGYYNVATISDEPEPDPPTVVYKDVIKTVKEPVYIDRDVEKIVTKYVYKNNYWNFFAGVAVGILSIFLIFVKMGFIGQ